ncbi:MAG: endonuclease domain-containing protein [Chloroflexi bacterium]|jgi:phosphoribosylformylglycinamidine synthase|nr:endonuclease domain-containing protein [Chloroflexota bacterium]
MSDDKAKNLTVAQGHWDKLKPLAREMRHVPTPAEEQLWQAIRNRRLNGAKFRRQHAIDAFIVDFVCIEHSLIIEVDGTIHEHADQQLYDADRQARLEGLGFRMLRFTNGDVVRSLPAVLEVIGEALNHASP